MSSAPRLEAAPSPATAAWWLLLALGTTLLLSTWADVAALGLLAVVVAAVAAWWLEGARRGGWRTLGLGAPANWTRVAAASALGLIATWAVVSGTVAAVSRIAGPPDLSAFRALVGNPVALAGGLAVAWINGAFAEEIVFRGFVFPRLARAWGDSTGAWIASLVFTSVVFGAAHAYQGWAGVAGTGVAGFSYTLAWFVGGRSLWAAVLTHGLYDTLGFVLVFLNVGPDVG